MTVRPRNTSKNSFSRDAWLEIDLNAVEYNYRQLKALVGSRLMMAVMKSDAYGHGASTLAPILEACGVDYFGVASVDEGIQLREAGCKKEILILSPTPGWSFARAIEFNLQITVSDMAQLADLEKLYKKQSIKQPIKIQLKINTGMNRNGAKWNSKAKELIQEALAKAQIFHLCGVFSHFACGAEDFFTQVQMERFFEVINQFDASQLGILHIEASSTLGSHLALNELKAKYLPQLSMLRVGLSLYGLGKGRKLGLRPVLALYARISQIQQIDSEEAVGYNLTWRAEANSTIGLLPLGYADGIKRALSNRIKVFCRNNLLPQIGNISMDQMSIDLSKIAGQVKVGDIVTLIGREKVLASAKADEASLDEDAEISLCEWSEILNTIDYEVACDLRARLPRVYVRK